MKTTRDLSEEAVVKCTRDASQFCWNDWDRYQVWYLEQQLRDPMLNAT